MDEVYTRKEAMELLRMLSTNAFIQLARKHPEAFIVVDLSTKKDKTPRYDKAALDRFARIHNSTKF